MSAVISVSVCSVGYEMICQYITGVYFSIYQISTDVHHVYQTFVDI